MTTPILKITEAANGQVDQYLTYNEALRALESSTNNFYVVDMSAGNVTLTDSANANPALNYIFSRNQVFRTSGNTVARVLTVPQSKRLFVVQNGGTFALTVKRGTSEISLAATLASIFYCDGTANGLVAIGSTGNYVAGPASSADNEIALFDGDSGKSLKRGPVIGTAAQANLVTSSTDTTAGNVVTVGWKGFGATQPISKSGTVEMNAFRGSEIFRRTSSSDNPFGTPGVGLHMNYSSDTGSEYAAQLFINVANLGTLQYRNTFGAGNWGSPRTVWDSSNLVKTTSATDTTAGGVLQVGDAGVMSVPVSRPDANGVTHSGFFRSASLSGAGYPTPAIHVGINLPFSTGMTNFGAQNFISVSNDVGNYPSAPPRIFWRSKNSAGSFGATIEAWTTGNTSADVQTMLGAANNSAIRSAISASSLPPYTLGTVPSAAANANLLIVITDLTGGREPCFSDGTNWLRCSDKTIAD